MKKERVQKPDKNSRDYLEGRLRYARSVVLVILLMTVINLVFLFLEYDRYFLFSASVPYYGVAIAKIFDLDTTLPLAAAAVILAGYLACWILAKKRAGAVTAALVMFSLDTLALLGITFGLMEEPLPNLMDILFHILAIAELAVGVSAASKLKKLPAEPGEDAPPPEDGILYS